MGSIGTPQLQYEVLPVGRRPATDPFPTPTPEPGPIPEPVPEPSPLPEPRG